MRKALAILLAAGMAVLMLSACGSPVYIEAEEQGSGSEEKGPAPQGAAEEQSSGSEEALPEPEETAPAAGLIDEAAYGAYLSILESEKDLIDGYTWQRGYYGYGTQTEEELSHPVVLCDVYGDDTPELIYIRRGDVDYLARFQIVTFENTQPRTLFSADWDWLAGGGQGYCMYQMTGGKALYIYESTGDDYWENSYYAMEENADRSLSLTAILQRCDRPGEYDGTNLTRYVEYTKNGESISEKTYAREEARIRAAVSGVLMYNSLAGDFTMDYVASHGCPAMTCDEAIAYLRGLLGITEPEAAMEPAPAAASDPAWSRAYRDFVLNKTFLNSGETAEGYGELENGVAVVTFSLHDMNGDDVPELIVFNGFNGRDLQANYVFTFTGTEVVYCGRTLAAAYAVDGCPGLFAGVTSTGWYLDDQYAGQYTEVTYLDRYELRDGVVTKESVSVTGLPISSSDRVLISRTSDDAIYEAAGRTPRYLSSVTWKELNSMGWDSFARRFYEEAPMLSGTYVSSSEDLSPAAVDALCEKTSAVIAGNVADSWGRTEHLDGSAYVGCYVLSRVDGSGPNNYVIVVFKNDVTISIPAENVNKQISYYFTLTFTDVAVSQDGGCIFGSYTEPGDRVPAGIPGHNYYYNGYASTESLYSSLIQPRLSQYSVSVLGDL